MISAVVVNHNGRRHLRRCLESLEALHDSVGEVVVVDNASQDGSAELVRQRFNDYRLLALDRQIGFGAANNRGAEIATGDSLLLLNSDAWIEAADLRKLAAALDSRPELGLVAPQLFYPDGRLQFVWAPDVGVLGEAVQKLRNPFESRRWNHRQLPTLLRRLLGAGFCTAACVLIRRIAYVEVGGFDEEFFLYFEDVDLCRRLRQSGWAITVVPDSAAYHVKGGSAGADAAEQYRRARIRYYRKHRPAWERRLIRWRQGSV
jgi:GT2 family glycosyltransferase